MEPIIFERGGKIYLVGSVAPIKPADTEIAALEFSKTVQDQAPNDSLLWLKGQYVEGDSPNRNGQFWTGEELAIKSLTPRLMPITVMHDPTTAVGLIADTKLLTPDADGVPRARIDTVLAIWAHRFPEIAAEIMENYEQGTLMQSMECSSSHYDCIECGQAFVKLPGGAERANWCDHLKAGAANGVPVRRLRDVTFTGTGLIFGTRNGATGANPKAHLDTFQSEVAEFHERAVTDRQPRRTSQMEISAEKYEELIASAATATALAARVAELEPIVAEKAETDRKLEAALIAQKAAEDSAVAEKAAKESLEEAARTETLASTRIAGIGAGFLAKLPDVIKATLTEQAKTLEDAAWTARLDELALLTKVPVTEGGAVTPEAGAVTTTETASTALGGSAQDTTPGRAGQAAVLTGLFRATRNAPAPSTAAGK